MAALTINGVARDVAADDDMPLLWALRDIAGLTGTKFGCGQALCGACTVLIDGQPARSAARDDCCRRSRSANSHDQKGAAGNKIAEAVQGAWVKLESVAQCGYCQSGQIMATIALLEGNKKPANSDIDAALSGNICRCATYARIRAAVHEAARSLA